MSSKDKEGERKFVLECIDVYRELPALWRIKSDEYSNRGKKDVAYEKLLLKYREHFENATKEDVKKKFNALRTNFRKEMKKVNDSKRSGAGTEELYEPSLWYYEAMLFLKDQETPATSRSSIGIGDEEPADDDDNQRVEDNIDDDMEEVGTPVPNTLPHNVSKGSKRKKVGKDEQRDELISLACKRLREPDNDNLNLAKTWVRDMSQMDQQQQLFARKAINDILFEGRMGTLHRFSVQINANTVPPQPSRSSTPFSFISHGSYQGSTSSNETFHTGIQGNESQLANYFSTFQP